MKINILPYEGEKCLYKVGELTSKIVQGMIADGRVYLYTKEARSNYANGLYNLLDELCAHWGWDKSKITLDTTNWLNYHSEYNIVFTKYIHPAAYFQYLNCEVRPWNKDKSYGMFIGRASASRIYALQKHNSFKFKNQSITSFNTELYNFMDHNEWSYFFQNSNSTYNDVMSISTPYSEIGPVIPPPITPCKDINVDWSNVYERIGIEVICETSTEWEVASVSEKLYRCFYFKRPFLLISSPNSLIILRNELGFKTFEGIIPEQYDALGEHKFQRIDAVFSLLEEIIAEDRLEQILEDSADILEHNHQRIKELCKEHRNFDYEKYISEK